MFDQRHEQVADPMPSSESSLDCSELQRAHAHQAKGTWDPLAVAQFHWSQEVVDRVLAWVYVTNGNRKQTIASGPMRDLTGSSLAHSRTISTGSIDERAWWHGNKPPGRCGRLVMLFLLSSKPYMRLHCDVQRSCHLCCAACRQGGLTQTRHCMACPLVHA